MASSGGEDEGRSSGADWSAWVADSVLYAHSRRPTRQGAAARDLGSDRLRVSDAERNEVAEALSRHYTAGRLDHDELEDRLQAAMTARTRGDLTPLLADLPVVVEPPPPPPSPPRYVAVADRASRALLALADLLLLALLVLVVFAPVNIPYIWVALVVAYLVRRKLRGSGRSRRRYHSHLHRHGAPHWHGPHGAVVEEARPVPPAGL